MVYQTLLDVIAIFSFSIAYSNNPFPIVSWYGIYWKLLKCTSIKATNTPNGLTFYLRPDLGAFLCVNPNHSNINYTSPMFLN